MAFGALKADPERAGEGSRSLPDPFNQQGKARLAPVGREVIFGSVTYYMVHSDRPDSPDGSAP